MRYCPTCGHEVSDTQKFCPNCSTKLRGAGAPTDAPPADVSNTVPRRPSGGWSLQNDDAGTDDLDDFFSSYRRKGPAPASDDDPGDDAFPTRRSRRRFQPDLSYDATPLPAAPQPDAPRPAVPGTFGADAPGYRPEVDDQHEGIDDAAPVPADDPENDFTRPSPVMFRAQQPKPVSAPQADEAQVPHWFEELDRPGDDDAVPREQAWAAIAPEPAAAPPAPAAEAPASPSGQAVADRPFDELIAGRAPGEETAAQPIVSRDFDRTGIVHVPRLDDGSAAPPAHRGDAGRSTEQQTVAPLSPQPAAQLPSAQQSSVQPTADQRAAAEQSTAQQPTAQQPAAQQPAAQQPAAQQPAAQQPAAHQPAAPQPAAPQPGSHPDVDAPWRAPETGQGPAVAPLPRNDDWREPQPQTPSPFHAPAAAASETSPWVAPRQAGDARRPSSDTSGAQPQAPQPQAPQSQVPQSEASQPHAPQAQVPPPPAPQPSANDAHRAEGVADRGDIGDAAPQRDDERDAEDVFAEWFGADDDAAAPSEDDHTIAMPRTQQPAPRSVDPAVERQRPWYEQGLDGTEETGQQPPFGPGAAAAGAAGAAGLAGATAAGPRATGAPASAPTYAPHGAGTAGAGASRTDASRGAPVDVRGAGSGPGGTRGPGGRPPGDGGTGGGGIRGAVAGLDQAGRRRLLTIAIALAGAVLLIASAFIIGNVIGGRDGDQAAPADTAVATAPDETAAAPPAEPVGPPPAVADPSFEPVGFESESGNLRCIITPEFGVACQHSNPAFDIPDEVCSTTDQSGAVIGLDSNGITYPCLEEDIPYGQETLPMDTPIHAGEFACTITLETGVTCFNATGDIIGLEFELGIGASGRASVSPQPTIPADDL